MKPEHFLARHSLFTRAELAAALPRRSAGTLNAHLARWRMQGRIVRVKNELYVRKDPDSDQPIAPDFIALASRMAPDAAASHHTALEAHGSAQSLFTRLTFVTWTRTKEVEFLGHRLVPVRPRVALDRSGRREEWIETLDREDLEVRVTSLERTLVDVLDRPSLAGGMEEVWRSLAALPAVDPVALLDYVRVLNNKTVAARVGYFLESRRDELAVPASTLEALQGLLPGHPVYMERALGGRLNRRWRVIVPSELAGPPEEAGA
jgi:predicted transcriptional regulator of viral defense system